MLLGATHLTCRRGGKNLFAPVSFSLAPGEALLVEGANGSGKSTLLRALAGLFTACDGTITASAQQTLYIGHRNAVHPALTVLEHLDFWRALAGTKKAAAPDAFDLAPLHARRAGALSEGQRRRLALARLSLDPAPVWLLDEPHAALDRDNTETLLRHIATHRAGGGAVMIASHGGLEITDAKTLTLGAPHD